MQTNDPINTLIDILCLKRGHCSVGERKFIEQFIIPLEPVVHLNPDDQTVAAYSVTVPYGTGGHCPVLWSCHIDTVHDPKDDAKQIALYDERTSLIYKTDNKCLGADDGAGVWLFLQMIGAYIPGTYLFHRGEERGGIGSKAMAKHHGDFIEKHTHAIAFDRRDTCSVITRQSRGRCCSDKFAEHLSSLLNDDVYGLKPDASGIYTDTAEYIGLIGECTNVSVGYFNEHGGSEVLDVDYLKWLRDKMLAMDIPHMLSVKERNAGDPDPDRYYSKGYGWGLDDGWDDYYKSRYGTGYAANGNLALVDDVDDRFDYDNFRGHLDLVNIPSWRITSWVRKASVAEIVDVIQTLVDEAAGLDDLLRDCELEINDLKADALTQAAVFEKGDEA